MDPYLSIVLPGIRRRNWAALYESAKLACKNHPFEMVIVGPGDPPDDPPDNFYFIEDWGSPSRAAQIGVQALRGKYMTWASDDGVFIEDSLDKCVSIMDEGTNKDAVIIRYREGGNSPPDDYFRAHHHEDLRLPGVPESYKIAPVGMYNTSMFIELGGWDCRFEHLNMCCHDLAFRFQNMGGNFHISPTDVLDCTWDVHCEEWQPVGEAYRENDSILWKEMYSQDQSKRVNIDYNNWIQAPAIWRRRFKIGE